MSELAKSPLRRYSKPHGAGDLNSRGLGQIMGSTELSRVELLLRETLQNAWDARLQGTQPVYGAECRLLPAEALAVLRREIFDDLPPESPLEPTLQKQDLAAVEIYDRRTSGLDGPLDPSSGEVDSEHSNFVKLIYDIGSTKPAGGGSGGTYGFGKTAAFTASASRTVVYWTVCRSNGDLEHRLIAVCHGDDYVHEGIRFTGVHWWGERADEDGIVLPVRGKEARRLGEVLFARPFADGETGTSLLVLDPLVDAPADEYADGTDSNSGGLSAVSGRRQLRELQRQISFAVAKYAWPKVTVPPGANEPPMALHIGGNHDTDPASIPGAPNLNPFKHALNALREFQASGTSRAVKDLISADGQLLEVRLQPLKKRPGGHFGDLVVIKIPNYEDDKALDRGSWAMNRLCNMRHEAELVVNYEEFSNVEAEGYAWFAVFKPRAEFDAHFAAAEPPAHDRWTPGGNMSSDAFATVKSAQTSVPRWIRKLLAPEVPSVSGGSESAVTVAEELRGFVPTERAYVDDTGRSSSGARTGARGRSVSSNVELVWSSVEQVSATQHKYSLHLQAGDARETAAELRVKARTSGKSETFDEGDVRIHWQGEPEAVISDASRYELDAGERISVDIYVPAESAIDVDITGKALADG